MARQTRRSKRGAVEPFLAMDVLARANAEAARGREILHLEVGQPGGLAPAAALEAARTALAGERIGYTDALGRGSLRARIARHYLETYGIEVDPRRIIVTTGSSAGFILAFLAVFDAGARVAVTEPGYPANRNILKALDLEPVALRVGPHNRWQPDAGDVEALHRSAPLDGLLVASPSNPTGTMLTRQAFARIVEVTEAADICFVSDEIYHGLTYGEPAATALAFTQRAIVINSFSKYYCMTGWRIGWMVLPDDLVRPVERLAQSLYISAPTLSQIAAEAVFDAKAELEARRAVYADNRRVLSDALAQTGLVTLAPADGAFYLYADVSGITNDSAGLARAILDETGVAVTPGADFDLRDGSRYLRLSYAEAPEVIAAAAARLAEWIAGRGR